KDASDDLDLPESIEIDQPPAPREKPIEAAKPPKVTPFPVAPKPAPAPPAPAAPTLASVPTAPMGPTLGEEEDVDLDAPAFETVPREEPAIEVAPPAPELRPVSDEPPVEIAVGRERELHVVAELESPIAEPEPPVVPPTRIDEPAPAPE